MTVPLQFASLYGGQEVFVWSDYTKDTVSGNKCRSPGPLYATKYNFSQLHYGTPRHPNLSERRASFDRCRMYSDTAVELRIAVEHDTAVEYS